MNASKLEIPEYKYMLCCAKFNGVECINEYKYVICGQQLCNLHYHIFIISKSIEDNYIVKNNYYITHQENRLDLEYLSAKYIKKILDHFYVNYLKSTHKRNQYDIYIFQLISVSYGILVYYFKGHIIKIYNDNSLKLYKILDLQNLRNITGNSGKKSIHRYIANNASCVVNKDINKKVIIFNNIRSPLSIYIRYLTKEKINEIFADISKMVEKFHKKGIAIGDLSLDNLAVDLNNSIVFINFYSFSDYEIEENTETNIFCSDLVTSSIQSMKMLASTKFSDLESFLWLYLKCINHPFMKKIETLLYEDSDNVCMSYLIKKKEKFLRKIIQEENIIQTSKENNFNFTDEVLRFINYFSTNM